MFYLDLTQSYIHYTQYTHDTQQHSDDDGGRSSRTNRELTTVYTSVVIASLYSCVSSQS